jgi:uncharacterized protein YecE (DUF72 family)
MEMEFGKVLDASGIDFTLPPDHPATARALAAASGDAAGLRIYAGCPVFQDDGIAAKLCPPRTPKAKRLACYGSQFNTLEVNSTGYGLVRRNVLNWASEVPGDFRFCPKVPRDVTHVPNLDVVWGPFASYCEDALAFGENLGPILLQFSEGFKPDRFADLERLLAAHAGKARFAVEVRHAAWFRGGLWIDRLCDMLQAYGVIPVITDVPAHRDMLHQRLTSSTAFIRMNGHALDLDLRRVEDWAVRVGRWVEMGLRELYFFPHTDPVDHTVDLAAHFIRSLNRIAGLKLKEPRLRQEDEEPKLAL